MVRYSQPKHERMPEKDLSSLRELRREWMSGAGAAPDVRVVFGMLQELAQRHGENFTVEETITALDQLIETAQLVKQDLQARKSQ